MFSGIAIDGPAKGKFLKSPIDTTNVTTPMISQAEPIIENVPHHIIDISYTTYRHFIDVSGNHYWTCEQGNVK